MLHPEKFCSNDCSFCLIPGQKVIANPDIKNIENLSIGEKVLTHLGVFKKITNVFSRDYDGDIFKIRVVALNEEVILTPEHPVLCIRRRSWQKFWHHLLRKPEWIEAKKLKKKDILLFPILKEEYFTPEILISDFVKNYKIEGEYIFPLGINTRSRSKKNKAPYPITFRKIKCKNKIIVDKDFLYVCGVYLGDGGASKPNLTFSFNTKKDKHLEKFIYCFKKSFGINPSYVLIKNKNTTEVGYSSRILSDFFKNFLGKGSQHKKACNWFIYLNKNLLQPLIDGMYDSDGYEKDGFKTYVTKSEYLKDFLKIVLPKIGFVPTIWFNKINNSWSVMIYSKKPKHNQLYKRIDENYVYLPIKSIRKEKYNGKVHNLEVEEDNSYVTSSFIVHNCAYRSGGWFKHGMNFLTPDWTTEADRVEGQIGKPRGKLIPEVSGWPKERGLKIPKEMHDEGIPACEITGSGEPTLWPYIKELFVELGKYDIETALVTNGQHLKPLIDAGVIQNLQWMRFSMDSCTSEVHSKVHGVNPAMFDIAVKNIERVRIYPWDKLYHH